MILAAVLATAIAIAVTPNVAAPSTGTAIAAANNVIVEAWVDSLGVQWRRFDASARPLDAPHTLSTRTSAFSEPTIAIAANRDGFLIVWDERGDVVGARVSFDGSLRDAVPLRITDDGGQANVASDGVNFFVSWSRPDPVSLGLSVFGSLVFENGEVAPEVLLSTDEPGWAYERPKATWTGGRYFVAWTIARTVYNGIGTRARFVSANGMPLDAAPIQVLERHHYNSETNSVASNGSENVIPLFSDVVLHGARLVTVHDDSTIEPGPSIPVPYLYVTYTGRVFALATAPVTTISPTTVAVAQPPDVRLFEVIRHRAAGR